MKKIILILIFAISIFSCNKDDEIIDNNEKIKISISKNIPIIKNSNFDIAENLDILFKLEGDNEEEVSNDIFNVDIQENQTNIVINLEIKENFRNDYEISTGGNIFSSIFDNCLLSNELDRIGSNESDYISMLSILCQNYNYDFVNSQQVTIPITFHLLDGCKLANINNQSLEQRLNDRINQVNTYFSQAKINFELKETNIFSVTHFQGYNILNQTRADEANMPYDVNSLNIYIADFIGPSIECTSKRQGVSQLPDSQFRTNRLFIEVWAFLDTFDPNSFLFSHELGHTFSLFHTFQNPPPIGGFPDCIENYCLENDDTICDTLPSDIDLDESLICSDSRVRNLMSYSNISHPNCSDHEFTYEQNKRMRFTAEFWYSDLFTLSNLPTVNTTSISDITETTATSGGNVTDDGGNNITSRGVCWSTSPNPTTANYTTNDGTGTGSFVSSLTGLEQDTQYYVRTYATNSEGTAYGNQEQFITLTNGNIPTVNTTSISNITETSATSGGNVTDDGGNNVTSRGVCWSISPNPTTANSITNDGNGTGNFTSSLAGLTENTTYYVRAYATNSEGTAYGSEEFFTTNSSGGGIYEGDVEFNSQQDIDDFSVNNYSIITGGLAIGAPDGVDLDFSSLISLTEIQGQLSFSCKNCTSLQGLNNITSVGYLTLRRFQSLPNFEGLNGLTNVNENVVIGGTFFNKNLNLYNFDGLDNLATVGGYIYARGNDQLQNIDAFSGLQTVAGDYLRIRENINLTNLCGLTNIVLSGGIAGFYSVYENAYNPTEQDIIDGNCSQ